MRSEILVTGATGFVGRHLLRALKREGRLIVAVSRQAPQAMSPQLAGGADRWIRPCDISVVDLENVACVVHLATDYGTATDLAGVMAANVAWPLSLLSSARRGGVPLFISADSFFGKARFDYPHMRAYTLSKRQFAQWGELQSREDGAPRFYNARFEHIYGPDDRDGKFVPALLAALKSGAAFPCTTALQKRDFLHVDDAVSALLALVEHGGGGPGFNEVEIGTGRSVAVSTFMEECKRQLGSPTVLLYGAHPTREGEIMDSFADPSALTALGWRAKHDHRTGIEALLSSEGVAQ